MALLACRPSISFDVTRPAQIDVSHAIQKIAVIDRVGSQRSKGVVDSFSRSVLDARVARYTIIDAGHAQQIYHSLGTTAGQPISRRLLPSFCTNSEVTGLVALEDLDVTGEWDISSRTDTETYTETVTVEGESQQRDVEREIEIFTASYSAFVQSQWRFYDCTGRLVDGHKLSISDSWSEEGDSVGDAKSAVGDVGPMIDDLSISMGTAYMQRVAPYESSVSRSYYRWGHPALRTGNGHLSSDRPAKAQASFKQAVEDTSGKSKGKAMYNLALSEEVLGELEDAWRHARKANNVLDSSMSSQYVRAIRKRRNQDARVESQLDAPAQAPSSEQSGEEGKPESAPEGGDAKPRSR
jgi:hypothetical protein